MGGLGSGGRPRVYPDAIVELAVGLYRAAQLKALGNGVVPQQCAAALRHLLNVRASAIAEGVAA